MNVIDSYKVMKTALIKEDLARKAFPYKIMMQHINGDFNISTFIRNGNAFGVEEIYYYGKKRWDRRGAVGTHNYKQLTHLSDYSHIIELSRKYRLIGVENNIPNTVSLNSFVPQPEDIYIFGEESSGILPEVLTLCSNYVYIPQYGSVRSLNVGTASGILMNYVSNYFNLIT